MLLEVRWETKRPFLVYTDILGFLSIFKKSQASEPFEALNSVGLPICQGMLGTLFILGWDIGLSLGTAKKIQTSLYLVR